MDCNLNFHFCFPKTYVAYDKIHCVKSVRIRSLSGLYSPPFGMNTDQKTSEYGHFSHSDNLEENVKKKSLPKLICQRWFVLGRPIVVNFLRLMERIIAWVLANWLNIQKSHQFESFIMKLTRLSPFKWNHQHSSKHLMAATRILSQPDTYNLEN